jgi:hypothetical protein
MTDIYVFGSNLAGRHGAGSAKHAKDYCGAIYGQGVGRQGNSYAIPTKDTNLKVLSLDEIRPYVEDFLKYANANPQLTFRVVEIGCGLAGFVPSDIAPLFRGYPKNVILTWNFKQVLGDN